MAVDPARGVIVANYNDMPNHNRLVPRAEAERLGWLARDDPRYIEREKEAANRGGNLSKSKAEGAGDPQMGVPYAIDVNAGWRVKFTGLLCKQPPYGGMRVIDLKSGRTLWDRPFGTARKNGPFGIPSMLPLEIGTPNNGGSAVTAVFGHGLLGRALLWLLQPLHAPLSLLEGWLHPMRAIQTYFLSPCLDEYRRLGGGDALCHRILQRVIALDSADNLPPLSD